MSNINMLYKAITAVLLICTIANDSYAFGSNDKFFKCGDSNVEFVKAHDNLADMRIANVAYAMEHVEDVKGQKYINLGDDKTYFWHRDDKYELALNGNTPIKCIKVAAPKAVIAPYYASGNEPGWSMEIFEGTIDFNGDYGALRIKMPIIQDASNEGTRELVASDNILKLEAKIENHNCTDTMSGEKFSHTVHVSIDGKLLKGCGQSLVRNVEWVLEKIEDVVVTGKRVPSLTFGPEGRIYGTTGCNNYNGSYSLEGETININHNIATTMMACIGDNSQDVEKRYLNILPSLILIKELNDQKLQLANKEGQVLVFKRK
jgi:heat shock protein HslJ